MNERATSEAGPKPESAPDETPQDGTPVEPGGVLAAMIEVEGRVATAISEAEAEAARMIAEAQSQAGSRAVAHDAATRAALRDLQSSLERERSETLAEIARQSDEAARCHLDIDEARVRALAERVATRIAEGDLASDEPEP